MDQLVARPPASERPARRLGALAAGGPGWRALAPLVLVALAVAARRPAYQLSHPFWVDEGWVADSVRAPLGQLKLVASSTPLGWTLLLRLVPPVGGQQHLRLLPLAFAAASVLPAWWFGLLAGRGRVLYGLAAGLAAAFVPAGLARHDLKQYTAEACLTLVLVLAAARLEVAWSWRRLGLFAGACILAFPFANVVPFASAALAGGLLIATAARRAWRRLAELAAATAVIALAQGAWYLTMASAADQPAIRAYWQHDYLPRGQRLGVATGFLGERFGEALHGLGLGPWPVALALTGLGLVALVRAGLGGVAVAAPLLAAELVVAAAADRYPLFDLRTSLFATTLWMVLAALGLAWLAAQLARWRPGVVLALALAAAVAVTLVPVARRAAARPLPDEDVRAIARYIAAHRRAGDAIVVSHLDAYPFAWYWPDRPTFVPAPPSSTVRFEPLYPPTVAIVARGSDAAAIQQALDQRAPGTRRVWVVAEHVTDAAHARWLRALGKLGATREPVRGLARASLVG
jgi:hypothetical protein